MDIKELKQGVKAATAYLAEHGIEVSHTRMLEALSRALGERNWSTLHAQQRGIEAAPVGPDWTPSHGVMSPAQYLAHGGSHCPFCASTHVDATELEADGPQAWDQSECLQCGATWKSAYQLSGFFDAHPGEPRLTPREDIIEELVEDVRARARNYGFSCAGSAQAKRLVGESAEALSLEATPAELDEASRRLA